MNSQLLLIDKPAGWTSFDVVAKIRSILQARFSAEDHANQMTKKLRVGHAGTLDPFATGLLIVLVGDETKNQIHYTKLDKEYLAEICLGKVSSTGDPEGEITAYKNTRDFPPTKSDLRKTLQNFTGTFMQSPPVYSAIKVKGVRAYKLARAGKVPSLKPREVTIKKINIIDYQYPKLLLKIECSSGTYIRSLADDIGKNLGCGGYLTNLRREKIGKFSIDSAVSIEEFASLKQQII